LVKFHCVAVRPKALIGCLKKGRVLFCVLLFALARPALAQPYYVAPAGDDANPGKSLAHFLVL
jgi:hypothetical protein